MENESTISRALEEQRKDIGDMRVQLGRIEQMLTERQGDMDEMREKLKRHGEEFKAFNAFKARNEKIPEEVEGLKKRQWLFAGGIIVLVEVIGGAILWFTRQVPVQ